MGVKMGENRRKELKNGEWIFHHLASQNLNVNALQRSIQSIASVIQYSIGQKNYSIHYLTGQNQGLSGLKIFGPSS